MNRFIKHTCILFILLILSCVISGCGALESDAPPFTFDPFYDDPNFYVPGDSLAGGDFTFTNVNVDVFLWDTDKQQFVLITDGSYVPPGKHTFGIKPGMRKETNILEMEFENLNDILQGSPMDQRVYASDGGNEYLVEAFLDEENELYLCDFVVDGTYITTTLFIEILYPDRRAKKEKVILATKKGVRPAHDKLIKEGMGVTINTEFVNEMLEMMKNDEALFNTLIGTAGSFMCNSEMDLSNLSSMLGLVSEVKPGKNSLMEMELFGGLAAIGINIKDIYTQETQEVQGPLKIEMPLSSEIPIIKWLPLIINPFINSITSSLIPEPISIDFDAVLGPLTDQFAEQALSSANMSESMELMMLEILDSMFPMNITAFANAFAKPEENTENLGALITGLYFAPTSELPTAEQLALVDRCYPDWPTGVTVDNTTPIDLNPIQTNKTDIGIAMSQYQINNILSGLGRIWALPMPPTLVNQLQTLIKMDNPSSEQELKLFFNPEGFSIEFLDSNGEAEAVLTIHDMLWVITDNDAPISIWSMDAAFKINVNFRIEDGNLFLDLTLVALPEEMKMHIIEDKIKMTFLDHSSFTKSVFDLLLTQELQVGEVTEFNLPINLTKMMGVVAKEDGTDLTMKNGNCYMSIALEDEGGCFFSNLEDMAGSCFISTIDIKKGDKR